MIFKLKSHLDTIANYSETNVSVVPLKTVLERVRASDGGGGTKEKQLFAASAQDINMERIKGGTTGEISFTVFHRPA